jgi:hypothetical protein
MWAMYKEVGEYYQHGVSLHFSLFTAANVLARGAGRYHDPVYRRQLWELGYRAGPR